MLGQMNLAFVLQAARCPTSGSSAAKSRSAFCCCFGRALGGVDRSARLAAESVRVIFRARHGADALGRNARSTISPTASSIRTSSGRRTGPLAAGEITPAEALGVGVFFALLAFLLVLSSTGCHLVFFHSARDRLELLRRQARVCASAGTTRHRVRFFGIPMAFAAIGATAVGVLVRCSPRTCSCDRIRHRVRDGGLRRRSQARPFATSALTFGRWDVAAVLLCYCAMLVIMAGVGFVLRFPWPYYIGLVVAAALLLDHWRLIRTRKREDCFRAFRRSHWIGFAVFGGILLPRVLNEIR